MSNLLHALLRRTNGEAPRTRSEERKRESPEEREMRKKIDALPDKDIEAFMAQVVLPRPDASTWDGLSPAWKEKMFNAVAFKASAIAYLTSFMDTHKDPSDFPFDLRGVAYIEEYLTDVLKPRDEDITVDVQGSGFVLGQCLAQMYGGKWVNKADDRQWPSVKIADFVINPYAKPVKFLANGEEDSLLLFARTVDPAAVRKQKEAFHVLNEWAAQLGINPKDCRLQTWTSEDGSVDYFKVYHTQAVYVVPISESARKRALKGQVAEDVLRDEVKPKVNH